MSIEYGSAPWLRVSSADTGRLNVLGVQDSNAGDDFVVYLSAEQLLPRNTVSDFRRKMMIGVTLTFCSIPANRRALQLKLKRFNMTALSGYGGIHQNKP